MPASLSGWKQKVVAFASGLGAPGLFLISFLDSSVLTFPVINDLLLIELSMEHPARMPLYAFMAALGSVLGCVVLYFIARKGGEAFFHRKTGQHAHAIRHWVERNGFVGMLIAALLPPPTPFKFFVFAAGVLKCRCLVTRQPSRLRGCFGISESGTWRSGMARTPCRIWCITSCK